MWFGRIFSDKKTKVGEKTLLTFLISHILTDSKARLKFMP